MNWYLDSNDGQTKQLVLTYNQLTATNSQMLPEYRIVDARGRIVVRNENDPVYQNLTDEEKKNVIFAGKMLDNTFMFQSALRQGNLTIQAYTSDDSTDETVNDDGTTTISSWKNVDWSSDSTFSDMYYTEDDVAAKSKYDTKMARINAAEKILDTELKQIETQQQACANEIDSVKALVKDHTSKDFKVFASNG